MHIYYCTDPFQPIRMCWELNNYAFSGWFLVDDRREEKSS